MFILQESRLSVSISAPYTYYDRASRIIRTRDHVAVSSYS